MCLTAARAELLYDFRREVARVDSDMSGEELPKLPHEQILCTKVQSPPTPPTPLSLYQGLNNSTQSKEGFDARMDDNTGSEAMHDQEKEAGIMKCVRVDEPRSKDGAKQNNGVYGQWVVTPNVKVNVNKPLAENKSFQNNGYAAGKGGDFFSSSGENTDH